MKYLLKQRLQPERSGSSWRESIMTASSEILYDLEDSPSLPGQLAEPRQQALGRPGSRFHGPLKFQSKALDARRTARERPGIDAMAILRDIGVDSPDALSSRPRARTSSPPALVLTA
jgi:hypothetical protein